MEKSDYLSEKGVDLDRGLVWFAEVFHDEDASDPLDYMDGKVHCGFQGRDGDRWRGGCGDVSDMEKAVGVGWSAQEGAVVVGDAYSTPRFEEDALALASRLVLLEAKPELVDEWFEEIVEKQSQEDGAQLLLECPNYASRLAFFLSKVDGEWVREQSYSDFMPSLLWSDIEQRAKELIEKDLDSRVQGDKYAVQLSYIDGYSKTIKVSYFSSPMHQSGWSAMEQSDGVWVPDHDLRAELEKLPYHEAMAKARSVAESTATMVAAYISGEVYWYRLCVFPLEFDEDDEPIDSLSYYEDEVGATPLFDENCAGFYGDESIQQDIEEGVQTALSLAYKELSGSDAVADAPAGSNVSVSMKMM